MNDDLKALEHQLEELRRLNQAQGEALIALWHTITCWPAKNAEEAELFDCSSLRVAREDVEAVQRILKERDEAKAALETLTTRCRLAEERDVARVALHKILDRIKVEEKDPHNDYGDVGLCIETAQQLAREVLGIVEDPADEDES